jgi:hypothetical protein
MHVITTENVAQLMPGIRDQRERVTNDSESDLCHDVDHIERDANGEDAVEIRACVTVVTHDT